MKKINFYFLALVLVLSFGSCRKDRGIFDPVVGPAGKDGSVIYSGSTAPNNAMGVNGDFYLDTSTALFYGPKTANGWGAGSSLKGPDGATGMAGSKIYSGNVVPPIATGVNGDYYLNTITYLLYGPKTAAGWGVPISLQGAPGPQGPEGNANVKTDVFSLKSSDWLWNSNYSFSTRVGGSTSYYTRYYIRANNSITKDVLDNGMVLVYFTPSPFNANQWAPLPYNFTDGDGIDYNIVFETFEGSVKMHFFFVKRNPAAVVPDLSTYTLANYKFKIVAVGGKLGNFMIKNHVDLKNYQEVSKVAGLWQEDRAIN